MNMRRGADIFGGRERAKFLGGVGRRRGGGRFSSTVIQIIGRELRSELEKRDVLKNKAKAFFDWGAPMGGSRRKFRKEERNTIRARSPTNSSTNVVTLCKSLNDDIDGILVLIDEADRPGEDAGLGALCKMFTERLTRKACTNVVMDWLGFHRYCSN